LEHNVHESDGSLHLPQGVRIIFSREAGPHAHLNSLITITPALAKVSFSANGSVLSINHEGTPKENTTYKV
jgi:hypothetical protein